MKYRKKPVEIEAMQWVGYPTEAVKEFMGDKLISEQREGIGAVGYFVKTLEGHSYMLSKNDFIIKGVQGEFYPCKPDIFELTYEKVLEDSQAN